MPYEDKLLEMLSSKDPQDRIHVLEQLSTLTDLSPELIKVVYINARDEDPLIAEKARQILHHEKALTPILDPMGINHGDLGDPDNLVIAEKVYTLLNPDSPLDIADSQPDTFTVERDYPAEARLKVYQVIQAITFTVCCFLLIPYFINRNTISLNNFWTWVFIIVYLFFIGIQVTVITKYGFKNSISFLEIILAFITNGLAKRG
jgi:hypothetical protein